MDIRRLRYLIVLGEERHFTRAARRLGIAQPALSQQIRRLESEVGLALVERTTRQVRVTTAGETAIAGARRVLREMNALQNELDALREVRTGRVVVGVTRTPGAVDVAGLLARFAGAHPGVEVDLREGLSVELLGMLSAGVLDLALIAEGSSVQSPSLDVRTVAVEPLVAIVPRGHGLGERPVISIRDLEGERIVTFHRGATIRDQLDEHAFAAGLALRVAFEIGDAQRARSLVANGLAIGILPASDARVPGPDVLTVPFTEDTLTHRTAVATWRDRRLSPAASALLALVDGSSLQASRPGRAV